MPIHPSTRRRFIASSTLALAGIGLSDGRSTAEAPQSLPLPEASSLPRWRGFNLLEMFDANRHSGFQELDFEWMAEWGFNFARLPLSYRCWSDAGSPARREAVLARLNEAVDFGKRYGIHVNLNLHRAPGYCVNPPVEPLNLWKDPKALELCAAEWAGLARRFLGVSNRQLSFDLLNEPAAIPEADYSRVIQGLVQAIRAQDPGRLIIADGLKWGRDPVHSLATLGISQSTRGYDPFPLTHYKAGWVGNSDKWPVPTWPGTYNGVPWDADRLRQDRIKPWLEIQKKGVGVHVGEWGVFNKTPHAVTLAFMKDQLRVWRETGWGWAVWNFRGAFGPLNSQRADVTYDLRKGQKIDRAMLDLLQDG